ncbi:MAG: hypothetical protein LC733_04455 [Actinobacteria bacterium]|nr:hypothetical protein [Actinomycetota bacterium]
MVVSVLPRILGAPPGPSCPLGTSELDDLLCYQVKKVLASSPSLASKAEAACNANGSGNWTGVEADLAKVLLSEPSKLDALATVLEARGRINGTAQPAPEPPAGRRRASRLAGTIRRIEAGVLLLLLTSIGLVPTLFGPDVARTYFKGFVVVVLASLPGWLFLRFIAFRAGALWLEYVLNLHRLGMDAHQNLPQPPASSDYFELWARGGGAVRSAADNIYRQKFETYYGKAAAHYSGGDQRAFCDRTLLPVFLATGIFAAGWTAVLWEDAILTSAALRPPGDLLRVGFMGAYSFILQMLLRRFFQSDLKPSAYLAAAVRVITVLILILVLHKAMPSKPTPSPQVQTALAFMIGFFPLIGMQLLQRWVSIALRHWVPTLRDPYPLSDLDGLSVWYEARLLEEGVEDMQNLVTTNLVDVLLHTRVPVGRLIDWIDQAQLYLLLDPPPEKPKRNPEHPCRLKLRRLGIRTATDLETAFRPAADLAQRARAPSAATVDDTTFMPALREALNVGDGVSAADVMLKTFCNSPNLVHVRHWRDILSLEHDQL